MKKSWIGLVTIIPLLACGEADQSHTSKNIPENGGQAGADNQVRYLLRGDMADRLATDFIGYEMNDPVPCASVYSDVKNDTRRCSYINILDTAGVKLAYPYDDGSVGIHPDEKVSWKELWQHTTEALGWIPYPDECLKDYPSIQASQSYSGYAAALCARGLLNDKNPDDLVTPREMSEWMIQTLLYQAGSCTRFDLIELMASYYQSFEYDPNFICQPLFPDVTSDMKLRCQLTEFMVKKGLIQGLPDGKFHGENQFNMAEFMKTLVFSSKLETYPCQTDACDGEAPKDTWYCSYADAVCKTGVLQSSFDSAESGNPDRYYVTIVSILLKQHLAKLAKQGDPCHCIDRKVVEVPGDFAMGR